MNDFRLFQTFGVFAIAGGVLRAGSAFIPGELWGTDVRIELFALVIDVALLFGLMGIYFKSRAGVGWAGFVGFLIAEAGIASIIGPDTEAFGVNTYLAGVHAISTGLAIFGGALLFSRARMTATAVCWIASIVAGVGGVALGAGELGFLLGGILFALGFVFGGIELVKNAGRG